MGSLRNNGTSIRLINTAPDNVLTKILFIVNLQFGGKDNLFCGYFVIKRGRIFGNDCGLRGVGKIAI